ncbi:ABC transporter ATP-binding protein, partial [Nocardia sp. JMUB6875]|uniref:ABC transporter ATP-binding protein n=1 Tax=Nocardia sp. JMUB6875 TaxID=3158170 RepID=UPI0034E8B29D
MLEVARLVRRFGEKTAVDDVSFTVPDGMLTGFVGGNGAGKTTTMRMIMGVLGIHAGEVRWDGLGVTAADRRRFGYMPEERGLYPKQPIVDQLVYLARLRGMSAAAAGSRADALLERFELGSRRKDKLESLSLGNQQRVQIAAAVIAEPVALVLDEPFSGLDPVAVDSMAALLSEYAAQGVPILFSSHQLDLVERLCDRLIILADGRVVAQGSAAELTEAGPLRYRLVLGGDAEWLR